MSLTLVRNPLPGLSPTRACEYVQRLNVRKLVQAAVKQPPAIDIPFDFTFERSIGVCIEWQPVNAAAALAG